MRNVIVLGFVIVAAVGVPLACAGDDDSGTCTPSCAGRECGWDPLCGTLSCGACPADRPNCNAASGLCSAGPCTPNCSGRTCGADPVCGTSCGTCASGQTCMPAGTCSTTGPTCPTDRDCTGRVCGPDPVCALSCGSCATGETCTGTGRCETTGCTDHSDCDANSLCLYGRCELAWGRSYTVTIYDGQIMERNPTDGSCWDDPCGPPDTKVTLTLDGVPHATAEATDTYNPVWDLSFTATISSSSTVSATMIEVDTFFDDPMFNWAVAPITINDLKYGGIQYVDATRTVNLINVFIEPVL